MLNSIYLYNLIYIFKISTINLFFTNPHKKIINTFMARLFLIVLLCCFTGFAGIIPPLYVGNTEPILDEFKHPLMGSGGDPTSQRCLIEIRTANDGIIRPPNKDGYSHPYNPLLRSSATGLNVSGKDTGLFCEVFVYRIDPTNKVFARAYNRSTAQEATFYMDTPLYTPPRSSPSFTTLILSFESAKPIDSGDNDNDGLNNSWEETLGIDDRLTSDYDDDGSSDYEEMLAGTAPDDPDSIFEIKSITYLTNQTKIVWSSVPGRKYQVQRTVSMTEMFTNLHAKIIADQYEIQKLINDTNRMMYYRVTIPID